MDDDLFEIEKWRGGWFYKFGSQYTGPFPHRNEAIMAAMRDLAPLKHRFPRAMRATLAHLVSA